MVNLILFISLCLFAFGLYHLISISVTFFKLRNSENLYQLEKAFSEGKKPQILKNFFQSHQKYFFSVEIEKRIKNLSDLLFLFRKNLDQEFLRLVYKENRAQILRIIEEDFKKRNTLEDFFKLRMIFQQVDDLLGLYFINNDPDLKNLYNKILAEEVRARRNESQETLQKTTT